MKKALSFMLPVLVSAMIFYSFSGNNLRYPGGAPAGYTGSPGDGKNCTQCHGGSATPVIGWITSDIDPSGYIPGQSYTITVTVTGNGAKGFEVSPQNASGTLLGTLTIGPGTELAGSGKYITHSSASNSNPKIWTFGWTAPDAGTGAVTFYGAFAVSEPVTRLSQLVVQENTGVSVVEHEMFPGSIFPNPAKDILNVELALGSPRIELSISDMQGRLVLQMLEGSMNTGKQKISADLTSLSNGVYVVSLQDGDKRYSQKIIVSR